MALGGNPDLRTLFDAISGEPLPGVRIKAKRLGKKGKWLFKTDENGAFPFGDIINSIPEASKIRFKIRPRHLGGKHIGLESRIIVYPEPEKNAGFGNFGLIPLVHPVKSLGAGDLLNERWLALVKEIFFSIDRQPSPRPSRTGPGARTGFAPGKISIRLSEEFTENEAGLIENAVTGAVSDLSANTLWVESILAVPAEETLLPEGALPARTVTIARNLNFSRPAVRIRYGNTLPPDEEYPAIEGVNPHEIQAALINLDIFTLNVLYKDGASDQQQREYAQSLIQRCVAYALGWRPTVLLPNRTVVDDNYGPPGAFTRKLITAEDKALALAGAGGGSLCYPPGIRFIKKGKPFLKADPDYPLNMLEEE